MNTIAKYATNTFFGICLVMSSALFAQEAQPSGDPTASQEREQTQTRDQMGAGNQMKQQQTREQKKDQTGAANQMKQKKRQSQGNSQGRSGSGKRGGGRG